MYFAPTVLMTGSDQEVLENYKGRNVIKIENFSSLCMKFLGLLCFQQSANEMRLLYSSHA